MEGEAALSRGQGEPSTSGSAPNRDAWRQTWERNQEEMSRLRQRLKVPVPLHVLRVNQVDAARLDLEMTAMLREQFLKMFAFVRPGLLSRYEAELNALLELLVWRFSIWNDKPTPGNALLNLRYRNERAMEPLMASGQVRTGLEGPGLTASQKLLYGLLTVGGRYGWSRLNSVSAFQHWGTQHSASLARRVWGLLQTTESIFKLANLLNLFVFLRTGKYKSVVERLLGARLVYERATMSRAVSFEYMNRQLVWNEFSELLLLVLPLLNIGSIKRVLAYPFSGGASVIAGLPDEACPICESNPASVPYEALPCGHVFCYYCIRTRSIAEAYYRCPRCSSKVVSIRRVQKKVMLEDLQALPT